MSAFCSYCRQRCFKDSPGSCLFWVALDSVTRFDARELRDLTFSKDAVDAVRLDISQEGPGRDDHDDDDDSSFFGTGGMPFLRSVLAAQRKVG